MDDHSEMDPETRRIVEASGRELMAKRAGKRTVSQLIAEDHTPRPYSVRLTPREIHRLRGMAHVAGIEASVLARQFIQEGLVRLEAQYRNDPDEARELSRILDIKLALLGVYDQIDGLERGNLRPDTPVDSPGARPS